MNSLAAQTVAGEPAAGATTGGLIDLILFRVATSFHREALRWEGRALSYGQLADRARAVAFQLSKLGVGRGDKVGILFPNEPDFVACFLAASGLGATVVPVNPLLKSEEIAHILADSEARCLIVHERAIGEAARAVACVPALRHVVVKRAGGASPPARRVGPAAPAGAASFHELTDLAAPPGTVAWPVPVEPDSDLALIVYTSGTTGKPKGAMLTHANMTYALEVAEAAFRVQPHDRFLGVLPLCHIYGMTAVMLGALAGGGTLVIVEKFEAEVVLDLLERERITVLPVVPAMYQFMLMAMEERRYDLSSVRVCVSGASSLPVEIFTKIEQSFGAPLIEGYGATEVSCIATFNRPDGVRKIGSVGLPFEGMELAIVDESGAHLPAGPDNVGEIAIKGRNVMAGYYQQPQATAESIRDGWFFTGDLGYKDEDGFVYIVGRKKEMIIRGGQNIYPREIEEVISRMKCVAEVAVIGVPDRLMGERVKAVVVARPGAAVSEDDVKRHCAEHLAEYKVPRLVEFVPVLPRNSTGKVLKRLLS